MYGFSKMCVYPRSIVNCSSNSRMQQLNSDAQRKSEFPHLNCSTCTMNVCIAASAQPETSVGHSAGQGAATAMSRGGRAAPHPQMEILGYWTTTLCLVVFAMLNQEQSESTCASKALTLRLFNASWVRTPSGKKLLFRQLNDAIPHVKHAEVS